MNIIIIVLTVTMFTIGLIKLITKHYKPIAKSIRKNLATEMITVTIFVSIGAEILRQLNIGYIPRYIIIMMLGVVFMVSINFIADKDTNRKE